MARKKSSLKNFLYFIFFLILYFLYKENFCETKYLHISLGKRHLCYVEDNKNLYCIKAKDKFNKKEARKERDGKNFPILSHVIKVSSGNNFSCAIDNRHDLYCVGNNFFGQLGNGTRERSNIAVKILSNVTEIDASKNYACAINEENELYCWGRGDEENFKNFDEKLKKDILSPKKIEIEKVKKISCSARVSCAVSLNGEAYCWGNLKKKNLGKDENTITKPTKISKIKNIQNVAISSSRIYFLKDDGKIYFVPIKRLNKRNENNEIKISPKHIKFIDVKNVDTLISNSRQMCIINKKRQALCMGNNRYGQLGNFKKKKYNTPTLFIKNKKIKEIAIGTYDICILTDKNKIVCKGKNQYFDY